MPKPTAPTLDELRTELRAVEAQQREFQAAHGSPSEDLARRWVQTREAILRTVMAKGAPPDPTPEEEPATPERKPNPQPPSPRKG